MKETLPTADNIGEKITIDLLNLEKYEDEYNEPIKLAAISTYLSRFASKGRIERTRTGREWSYQTIKLTQKHNNT